MGRCPLASHEERAPSRSLLTPKQACVLLTIGARKLWELTNRGEIPHLRIGRSLRYVPEDLEEWIQQQKKKRGRPRASGRYVEKVSSEKPAG